MVSGFRHAGISAAIDNNCESEQDEEGESDDNEVEEEGADVLSGEAESDDDDAVILCDSD